MLFAAAYVFERAKSLCNSSHLLELCEACVAIRVYTQTHLELANDTQQIQRYTVQIKHQTMALLGTACSSFQLYLAEKPSVFDENQHIIRAPKTWLTEYSEAHQKMKMRQQVT